MSKKRIIALALIAWIVVLVCLLTNPPVNETENLPSATSMLQIAPATSDTPVVLSSNGMITVPYQQFLWSKTWDSKGWLAADAMSVAYTLPEIAKDLPIITKSDDLDFIYGKNASFSFLSVYNERYERIYHAGVLNHINTLPTGTYYISIDIAVQGKYISEAKGYEVTGYECVFKLIVP